jgi:hypothetical protein
MNTIQENYANPTIMRYNDKPATAATPTGQTIELMPRSLKELSGLYRISVKTFKKWLLPFEMEIGKRIGNYYTIPQVKKIFELLGFPCVFEEK